MKTIFITGASSGIGKATAELFSANGWQVIATMRNLAKGEELAQRPNVVLMPLDLNDRSLISETCRRAMAEYDIDVVFNNAGYAIMAPVENIPEKEMRQMMETDFYGTLFVIQEFIPYFKQRRGGMFITTTSLAGVIGFPCDGVYGAAKRAVMSLVETMYYELKPYGVTSKALIPGGTKTNFQVSFNEMGEYAHAKENQYHWLLCGDAEFPGPDEAAHTVWRAATDGKDKMHYPADHLCQQLYDLYMEKGVEEFKKYYAEMLYK